MKGFLDSLRKLGMVRVLALAGVAIGVMGAFLMLELQGPARSRMTMLASNLDAHSVQQITDELDRRKIPYRVDGGAGPVFVPDSDLGAARRALDKAGVQTSGTTGYEIFDRSNDFTSSDFDQQVKLTRALEGELARTIESVHGIAHARVHLVLSRREPFAHDREDAQASVMLTFAGRGDMAREAIQSVVNLVAAGVPGLKPQNVTVVDSNLHLLVQAGDPNDPRVRSQHDDDVRQQTERRLSTAVEEMLEHSLGAGHVHAEASIRMNFDRTKETEEKFDPDSSVVRSTQTVNSSSKSTDKAGPVSLANNLPNADAGSSATGSQDNRQEETTNYEITKTVRAIVHDQPQVERITLAVMVDGKDVVAADGKHSWQPRSATELAEIDKLVKSAIGFDAKRGDQVDVVSMPFVSPFEATETTAARPSPLQNGDLMNFVRIVAFGVVGLGIILMAARSIIAGLRKEATRITVNGIPANLLTGANAEQDAASAALEHGGGGEQTTEEDGTVTLSNIQGQMRASSIRKVTALVDQHPDATLGIIRSWLQTDAG